MHLQHVAWYLVVAELVALGAGLLLLLKPYSVMRLFPRDTQPLFAGRPLPEAEANRRVAESYRALGLLWTAGAAFGLFVGLFGKPGP